MRCIEIYSQQLLAGLDSGINRNMRCIEMDSSEKSMKGNFGLIET